MVKFFKPTSSLKGNIPSPILAYMTSIADSTAQTEDYISATSSSISGKTHPCMEYSPIYSRPRASRTQLA